MPSGSGALSRPDTTGNRTGKTPARDATMKGKEFPYDGKFLSGGKDGRSAWDALAECMSGGEDFVPCGQGLEPKIMGGASARMGAQRGMPAMLQPVNGDALSNAASHWHAAQDALDDDEPFTKDSVIHLDLESSDDEEENPPHAERLTKGPNDDEENPR